MTTELTTDLMKAEDEVRNGVEAAPMDRLLERIADRVGARATVQAVFGEPVRHDGVTVIPVARVRWGFGGGGGRTEDPTTGPANGTGGGGGVLADPIGYLEIGADGATFKPIAAAYPSPLFILASGICAAIVLRSFARLFGR